MNKTSFFFTVIICFFAISCTPSTNPHFKVGKPYVIDGKQYVPNVNPKYAEIGMASWYGNGDGFHNKLTANGELFDRGDMTAAHKTLPLPSIVTVTNLENGRTVKLRVNDRGPFVTGRIIDVSEKAAKKLGFHSKGSAKVLVELDKEGSIKALNNIPVSSEEKARIVAAYNGESKYVSPVKIVTPTVTPEVTVIDSNKVAINKSKDIAIIRDALSTQNDLEAPKSMGKVVVAAPVKISSNVGKVEKIVIREEIVKPQEVTYSAVQGYGSPKSMPHAQAKNYGYVEEVEKVSSGTHYVQVASLNDIAKASDISSKVSVAGDAKIVDAIVNGKQYYRVRIGGFSTRSEAEKALDTVRSNGYGDAFIVTEK